jgi:hypothetical protein
MGSGIAFAPLIVTRVSSASSPTSPPQPQQPPPRRPLEAARLVSGSSKKSSRRVREYDSIRIPDAGFLNLRQELLRDVVRRAALKPRPRNRVMKYAVNKEEKRNAFSEVCLLAYAKSRPYIPGIPINDFLKLNLNYSCGQLGHATYLIFYARHPGGMCNFLQSAFTETLIISNILSRSTVPI